MLSKEAKQYWLEKANYQCQCTYRHATSPNGRCTACVDEDSQFIPQKQLNKYDDFTHEDDYIVICSDCKKQHHDEHLKW